MKTVSKTDEISKFELGMKNRIVQSDKNNKIV